MIVLTNYFIAISITHVMWFTYTTTIIYVVRLKIFLKKCKIENLDLKQHQ